MVPDVSKQQTFLRTVFDGWTPTTPARWASTISATPSVGCRSTALCRDKRCARSRHFERADVNGDGVLSFAEFYGYVTEEVLRKYYSEQCGRETEARRVPIANAPLLEARVQQLVPSIDEHGCHPTRTLPSRLRRHSTATW